MKLRVWTKMLFAVVAVLCIASCRKVEKKVEQLTYTEQRQAEWAGIPSNGSSTQALSVSPGAAILTGVNKIRLIPIYKVKQDARSVVDEVYSSYSEYWQADGGHHYFMPGMDIVRGYYLVNIGHYNMETEKLSYLFNSPVLIKNLYFPGVKADSLNGKPIARNYFLVSVYDEDTNQDSLINKKDLRKIYHIDQLNAKKTQLIPNEYSVLWSTYDYKNDVMYIYARFDANKNGAPEKDEPISIFWIKLDNPTVAKKML